MLDMISKQQEKRLYYVGLALMNRKQLDSALTYFYKCDEAGRFLDEDVSGFTIKVNMKIGNIYDAQGKRSMAIEQYKKVLKWDDRQQSHEEAKRYINNPFSLLIRRHLVSDLSSFEQWQQLAEKELKGASSDSLNKLSAEQIVIKPIYSSQDIPEHLTRCRNARFISLYARSICNNVCK